MPVIGYFLSQLVTEEQKDLAARSLVSATNIGVIETGRISTTIQAAEMLCKALGKTFTIGGGEAMKYKNGKEYKFRFGKVTVLATFEGLTDAVADKFNRLCAEEKARAYRQKGAKSYVG